ncbi:MAG: YHS domain-containing protein [Limnothrix sp. RL_2_0]|nr:YHS domain-containing protein [Limnothrix sp. RL_2_0]
MKINLKQAAVIGVLLSLSILGGCGSASQTNEVSETSSTSPAETVTETPTTSSTETSTETTETVDIASFINKDNDVAIKGTDPVAYFTESQAVAGKAEFAYEWNDAVWHFASAENRGLFSANPEKYAPKYGGYCAWAASQGYTADIDPEAWTIVDGSLYLNFNAQIQKRWEKDTPGFISQADIKWPSVVEENS